MNRLLYSFAQWWLSVLPVDEAGRRVFEETLSDWRREAARASSLTANLFIMSRALFSVGRSVVGVAARETLSIRRSGVLTRVCLWIALCLVFLNVWVQFSSSGLAMPALSRLYAQVGLAAFVLPVALLLGSAIAGKGRTLPALGLSLVMLFSSVALLGWGAPLASRRVLNGLNRAAIESGLTVWSGDWTTEGHTSTRSFINDLSVVQLSAKIIEGPKSGGWPAIGWMSFFVAYVATCTLLPVFASALRRQNKAIRFGGLSLTILLLFVPTSLSGLYRSFTDFSVTWWLGAYWIPVAWIALCMLALSVVSGNDRVRPRLEITNNQ